MNTQIKTVKSLKKQIREYRKLIKEYCGIINRLEKISEDWLIIIEKEYQTTEEVRK